MESKRRPQARAAAPVGEKENRCPACGDHNLRDKRFCSTCGERLGVPTATSIEDEPAPAERGPRRIWPIALVIFLLLASLGAGVGYLAGSLGVDRKDADEANSFPPEGELERGITSRNVELPQIACAVDTSPIELAIDRRPAECIVVSAGAPPNPSNSDITSAFELEWIEWGSERAIARGMTVGMGTFDADFEFSDPRRLCGNLVFTKFRVTIPGNPGTVPSPISACVGS